MTAHTLVLLRHAKAELPVPGMIDAHRPLAKGGRADAEAAGAWLAANDLIPDLVLCSPALRTRQTWECVRAGMLSVEPGSCGGDEAVAYVPSLYSSGVEALIDLVSGMDDEIDKLLVIGHNPTVSVVSAALDPVGGSGNGLQTATLAVHTVPDGLWAGVGRGAVPLSSVHAARGIPGSGRTGKGHDAE